MNCDAADTAGPQDHNSVRLTAAGSMGFKFGGRAVVLPEKQLKADAAFGCRRKQSSVDPLTRMTEKGPEPVRIERLMRI